eukprot:sb/3470106/
MPMSLWELTSDHYLHHQYPDETRPYTAWWDMDVWEVKGKSGGRSLSVRTKPVSDYRSSKTAAGDSDSSSDSDESDDDDSVVVSEALDMSESVTSPIHPPRALVVSPPVDVNLYRSYAADSVYINRGVVNNIFLAFPSSAVGTFSETNVSSGTFTVRGPCYKTYTEMSNKPVAVPSHTISPTDRALYAKKASDVTVSDHSKQFYQSYCSLLTL